MTAEQLMAVKGLFYQQKTNFNPSMIDWLHAQ